MALARLSSRRDRTTTARPGSSIRVSVAGLRKNNHNRRYSTASEPKTSIPSPPAPTAGPTAQPTNSAMPRHFIAVFPPTEMLDKLQDMQTKLQNDPAVSRIKWTSRYNLHLPLGYLGPALADAKKFRLANQALTEIISTTPPFDIELVGLGVFPKAVKPRVLWVGVNQGKNELKILGKRLDKEFGRLGILRERETREEVTFHHVAIGRWNELYTPNLHYDLLKDKTLHQTSLGTFQVKEALLMNSVLHPDEPLYQPVSIAPFQGHASTLDPVRRRNKVGRKL